MMSRSRVGAVVLVLVAGLVVGCSLKGMRAVPADRVSLTPPADQATIVFLRPAPTAATTSLFELPGAEDRFIGLLVQNTRLVYLAAPGKTRFMVIGKSASFLDADLQAGKMYQVAVLLGEEPDEQFRLAPMRPGATVSGALQDCVAACQWVVNTEKSEAWARQHASSVQRKKAEYLPRWERRSNRPMLVTTDGR